MNCYFHSLFRVVNRIHKRDFMKIFNAWKLAARKKQRKWWNHINDGLEYLQSKFEFLNRVAKGNEVKLKLSAFLKLKINTEIMKAKVDSDAIDEEDIREHLIKVSESEKNIKNAEDKLMELMKIFEIFEGKEKLYRNKISMLKTDTEKSKIKPKYGYKESETLQKIEQIRMENLVLEETLNAMEATLNDLFIEIL